MHFNNSHRENLNAIFRAALSAVNGKRRVAQYLRENPVHGDIYLLAIGKAAAAMTNGAFEILAPQINKGLVITKSGGEIIERSNIRYIEAGHPVPDERSISAGSQLLEFIDDIPRSAKLLCLISGGASALVEVLPSSVSLSQLQELNDWLLKSGVPIGEMNAIRKRVSQIKGGRLAKKLNGQDATVLLISDVQGDDPANIGSGLLFAPNVKDFSIEPENYPKQVAQLMRLADPLPDKDDPCFGRINYSVVASLKMAMDAAQQMAISIGYEVSMHWDYLQGDAIEAGKMIGNEILKMPGILQVWGGESTVNVPEKHGIGGRCQSLALSAALVLRDQVGWCLLAAGTDGCDGNSNAAGVCVDSESMVLGRQLFPDKDAATDYLQRADAGSFFQQTNDLIITGATGTNVTDVVLAYMD